jgi:putative transposase
MDSEDIRKQLKKPVEKKKLVKKIKEKECSENNCEQKVDTQTNRYFCLFHFNQHSDDNNCNKENCSYKASYKGFCGHHISKPKITNKKPVYATCRKIRLEPTIQQRILLARWFGVARKCYNSANCSIKNKSMILSNVRDLTTYTLDSEFDYVKIVPSKIKQGAIEDLIKATSNAIKKYKTTNKFQDVHYKKKNSKSDSINININSIKPGKNGVIIYPKKGLGFIKTSENINNIPTSCRITCKYGRFYYLCIPLEIEYKNEIPVFEDGIVALDPGVRTANSFYSPLLAGEIGINTKERLNKSFNEADFIQSKMKRIENKIRKKKLKGKKKHRLNKKAKHLRKKFLSVISKPTRLVKELHSKTALFLCKNFHTIIIPDFSSKQTAKNLSRKVNRQNQALSHFSFRQRLSHTAKRLNRKVHVMSEAYTSKTCTNCGFLNDKNSDKILTCSSCRCCIDRDIQGSRNIWIKNVEWFKSN